MGWYTKPDNYQCKEKECEEEFQFVMDTMFIATHGGLPIKCPKCKSENITKIGEPSIG